MSQPNQFSTTTEAETASLARRVAAQIDPGDILLLAGPVGAGKSVFARSLIQHLLGATDDVPSPTFTLVQRYETASRSIVHADLYRLKNSLELEETGLLDEPDETILVIEWPELLPAFFRQTALSITITPDGPLRRICFSSTDQSWLGRMSEIADGP